MAESEKTHLPLPEKEKNKEYASLPETITRLAKFGGFDLLEATIDGVQNLNPEKKARRNIFLTEANKKEERDQLRKRLQLYMNLLEGAATTAEMIESAEVKIESSKKLLNQNLKQAIKATAQLERSYRSMSLFYKNTEVDKLRNLTILNGSLEQIKDLELTTFIDAVADELDQNYDRLDLRDNYSILVLPGYLGSNAALQKWAKIAHKNKVMLVTDFQHLDAPDDVIDLFEAADHTGGDAYLSNVVMTCNWLVGRGRYEELGEEEDLYIGPSTALAGKMYTTLMSQVTAGKKHGALNEIEGVRFPLKKSEIASLEKMGLVPMVNEYGKIMAFSAKTLFNGDNLGLQTYSVVRVFDYVLKVLIDFLNRRAFENFDHNNRMDIQKQIIRFLDGIAGPGKLIEKFKIIRFEQDENQKDRIFLDIHMIPYFPAKSYMIKLDGQKGDDPNAAEWKSEYAQE